MFEARSIIDRGVGVAEHRADIDLITVRWAIAADGRKTSV